MHAFKKGRGGGWVVAQLVLLAAIALVPRRLGGLPEWPAPLRTAGLAGGLMAGAAGALLALLGALALERNLTPFPRPVAHGHLVQHGAYRVVRHPIYSGIIFMAFGWALARANTPALVLAALLGLFFDRKAAFEERWLVEAYPDYAAYRQHVRKLIPCIY
jgi:protein-S-isoprenylcysteine O-methyltransferase Ste14